MMKIATFKVEEWMNLNETKAVYNIAETCVDSVSVDELFQIAGRDKEPFFKELFDRRLTYGAIYGAATLKEQIATLYRAISPEQIITTHGATGANHLVLYSLVEPGDEVVSVMPTYQQLYSIPASYGATVRLLKLRKEDGFQPDMAELKKLITPRTKVICINNPNNPTGALMAVDTLNEIVAAARSVGAYILCDEVYRFLTQTDQYSPSVADLYEKGIVVGSMSKVFSLAGIRLGWIATRDAAALEQILLHRDYDTISCGIIDEALASVALEAKERLLSRNKKIIRDNLAVLDQWISTEPRFSYVKPQGGTTALLYCNVDVPSETFCQRLLAETGAFLTPGSCFEEEGCFRIGYACDTEELRAGLAKLSDFVKGL